jgi:glycolate oxidase FAD binding subunit
MQPASTLETFIHTDSERIAWERLDASWQERIRDAIASSTVPDSFLAPHTVDALCTILAQAHANNWRVLPCGNGSKLDWGGLIPQPVQLVLSSRNLNRIIDHAVGDLTVTVEAGVKLADLQQHLAQTNQYLPLNPAYPDTTTIGGLVATADTWREQYGGLRDVLLGISFVRADGKLAKAGGRVVKNVAGYDMMKLFSGSYGTLGFICQVTLRTYPIPADSATLVLTGAREKIAKAAQTLISSSLTPNLADILSAAVVAKLQLGMQMGLMVRFRSIAASVNAQIESLQAVGEQLNLQTQAYRHNDETELWHRLQSLMRDRVGGGAIACKIGVLPTSAVDFLDNLDNSALAMVHASTGLGRLQLPPDSRTHHIRHLREVCQNYQGFLTVLEAPKSLKQHLDPWGYPGNAIAFMRKIKAQFDPQNILSPNRFVGEI